MIPYNVPIYAFILRRQANACPDAYTTWFGKSPLSEVIAVSLDGDVEVYLYIFDVALLLVLYQVLVTYQN